MADLAHSTLLTGTDLIAIEPVRQMASRYGERFLTMVYTPAERQYCGDRVTRMACIFAAKEATAKALGVGLAYMARGGVELHELEIVGDTDDRLRITLYGSAQSYAQALDIVEWSVSSAHSRTSAVAYVIALRKAPCLP
ncbi:MAG: holo-ACP synthase [Oscillochloris sp.]|nr:holo-ACP synthase [Oscillochloris sp.]